MAPHALTFVGRRLNQLHSPHLNLNPLPGLKQLLNSNLRLNLIQMFNPKLFPSLLSNLRLFLK